MKINDFKEKSSPWFDIEKWENWMESKNIIFSTGNMHNHTDGGVHYILTYKGNVFDFQANYWDYRGGWGDAIDWVEKVTNQD